MCCDCSAVRLLTSEVKISPLINVGLDPTTIRTNSREVMLALKDMRCTGDHEHQRVEGQEGGRSRSKASQIYPQALCQALADAVAKECRQRLK